MIGAGKPVSRSCPVVLDPTVAASFAGLIGGALGADAVQRGRSPFADRLGEELAGEALVLHDDGRDPEGPASAPFDGEGVPRRRTALIEGGRLRTFLYDTYTANRGARRFDRQRRPRTATARSRRSRPPISSSSPARSSFDELLERGRRRRLRHRRRRASLGRQPGHRRLLGRRLGAGDPRRRAGRAAARVHDRQRPGLDAGRGARRRRRGALGPVRGLGADAAAADRGDGCQRF